MALTNKGNFIIAGHEYTPKSLKVNIESIVSEDSGRADDGTMHIDWVKNKVRKLEIEMPPYTAEKSNELKTLLQAVQGREYQITYYDVYVADEKTITVYTSNLRSECYSGVLYQGVWTGVAFNAIEKAGEN